MPMAFHRLVSYSYQGYILNGEWILEEEKLEKYLVPADNR
jgi:hypothetical protein